MSVFKFADKKKKEAKQSVESYLAEFDEVIRAQLSQCIEAAQNYVADAKQAAKTADQYAEIVKDSAESNNEIIERAQWHAKWANEHAKYAETSVEIAAKGALFVDDVVSEAKAYIKSDKAQKYISWAKKSVEFAKNIIESAEKSAESAKVDTKWVKGYAEEAVRSNETITLDPTIEIRKYKILLDDGIITDEEFDKKKSELLNI